MHKTKKLLAFVGVLFIFLILDGCTTAPKTADFLHTDSHSSPRFKALVFGRIKFNSEMKIYEDKLWITLFRKNVEPNASNHNFIRSPILVNNRNNYEVPFVLEIVPGSYDLRSIVLSSKGIIEGSRLIFSPKNPYLDDDKSKGYDNKIQHIISVGENEMLYMGTINIDIQRAKTYKPGESQFQYLFEFRNNFDEDIAYFKKKHPNLYIMYKDKIKSSF